MYIVHFSVNAASTRRKERFSSINWDFPLYKSYKSYYFFGGMFGSISEQMVCFEPNCHDFLLGWFMKINYMEITVDRVSTVFVGNRLNYRYSRSILHDDPRHMELSTYGILATKDRYMFKQRYRRKLHYLFVKIWKQLIL